MAAAFDYRQVTIRDVAHVNAHSIKGNNAPSHIDYIDISSVGTGEFIETPKSMAFAEAPSRARRIVKAGDTILSTVRPNRRSFLFLSSPSSVTVASTGFAVLSPTPAIDARYLYYWVTRQDFTDYLTLHAKGAAYPAVSAEDIGNGELLLPPLPIQRRIAGILSAYDELIENSQRRIKILESMARALYREWFVHFRFPGHESVPRVPSPLGEIPQGWEASTLGAHLLALESGKRPKGGIREVADGVPSIGAENINGIGQHDFAGEKFIPREFFQEMRKGIVRDRDVAIYKDGAYIGKSSYFRDGFPHIECCVNEHVFLLRASGVRLKQNALYLWLQEPDTVQTIRSKNANAAQPGINQQTVGGLELTLPNSLIAAQFDELVDPLFAEVINLAKKIQTLRRTRDLLLPRLLSGQIDVEALDHA
ncbi:restriction endonuclease subunit S [Accumulibacter sp.]|uniref:restriction endonuclease subunit S n=1 Tax=Accumulibacter sp. TaxID=2053492 RepID=UPI0025CFE19A|nr:restriction endonuclease subunit S [Accumulibacter sp.]MCM8626218.1 restriction endonuclease subunit S [Accumulibacter sp.]